MCQPRAAARDPPGSHDTRIIADGFSCREQVGQLTGRRTWHLAEVVRESLGETQTARRWQPDRRSLALPAVLVALGTAFIARQVMRRRGIGRAQPAWHEGHR